MTSKIKVDNINKVSDDTNIIKKCGVTTTVGSGSGQTIVVDGDTVTLGRCSGTVALASGASQTGFGRTGTVDWQTSSIKTATFTAANGEGYFCNTAGGTFEMDLPAGSAGAIVSVQDYNNTFDTNALTVDPNGSEKINGGAAGEPVTLDTEGRGVTFVYIDATVGWRSVQDNDFTKAGSSAAFVTATGGTVTCCGNFKIHTFTGPGTFQVTCAGNACGSTKIDYLVVAGGGASTGTAGSGAGAGGFRLSNDTCMSAPQTSPLATPTGITASVASFPIVVGAGGTRPDPNSPQAPAGSVSSGLGISSAGGAGGVAAGIDGQNGASGSGGGGEYSGSTGPAGSGNTPPVSPPQGNNGGTGGEAPAARGAGGGGGAACVGANGSGSGGNGGAGSFVVSAAFAGCNGESGPVSGARYFAGGGGGGFEAAGGSNGLGGVGGGGDAGPGPGGSPGNGQAGVANTGGGGGGGSRGTPGSSAGQLGGSGGSGIVIIRYKFQ
jgi:hypothetical protein